MLKRLIPVFSLIVTLASCSSIKPLNFTSNKPVSTAPTRTYEATSAPATSKKEVKFLNDISVQQDNLKCKIANSKNANVNFNTHGIGIQNVKKRLAFLYPEKHELKLSDAEDFFVVSLSLQLKVTRTARYNFSPEPMPQIQN